MRTEQNGSNLEMTTNKRKEFFLTEYLKVIGKLKELDITCLNDLLKSKDKLLEDEYCFSDWLKEEGIVILKNLSDTDFSENEKLNQVFAHAVFLLKQSSSLAKGYVISSMVEILSFVNKNSIECQNQYVIESSQDCCEKSYKYYITNDSSVANRNGYLFLLRVKELIKNWTLYLKKLKMNISIPEVKFN